MPNQPGLQQNIVFFPAYPLLVRGVGRILGGRLTSYIGAGMLVSFAAFFGALIYLYALARDTLDEDQARFAVWADGDVPVRAVLRRDLRRVAVAARDDRDVLSLHARASSARAAPWGLLVGLTKTNGVSALDPARDARHPGRAGRAGRAAARAGRTRPGGQRPNVVTALAAAAMPGIGMLIYSAYVWQLTGDPLGWLEGARRVGPRVPGARRRSWATGSTSSRTPASRATSRRCRYDLINALGAIFVLAAVWPVARRLGLAYAVFILVFMLPPLAAGGLISAGRFSSVLFPAFLWLAGAVAAEASPGMARLVRGLSGAERGAVLHLAPALLTRLRASRRSHGAAAEGRERRRAKTDIIRGEMCRHRSRAGSICWRCCWRSAFAARRRAASVAQGQRRAQAPRRAGDAVPGRDPRLHRRTVRRGRHSSPTSSICKDPDVVALRGARGDRARALRRGRSRAAAAASRRAPASEAALELGLLQQMLGRPGARARRSRRVAALADDAHERAGAGARAAARCARSAASRKPTRPIATRRAWRPTTPRSTPAGASCSSRSTTTPKRVEVVPGGAASRSALGAGAGRRRRRRSADDNPPQAAALAKRALEINPSLGRRARLPRQPGRSTPSKRDEARAVARQGARDQSVEPRGARARSAALAYVEDKHAGVRGRGRARRWRSRPATARSTAWPASWPRTTTGSTKRWR